MAYMYRTDCFTEDSPPHHTLVFGEIQTMDCCMTLPSELFIVLIVLLIWIDHLVHIALLEDILDFLWYLISLFF
jgi:hypothetical protein